MFYVAKTPNWVKKLFPGSIWDIKGNRNTLYLTFDDGPHPQITDFVLDELKRYDARATFFCIGKNVADNKLILNRIVDEGHAIGNHTYNHVNGWKTSSARYVEDVDKASQLIDSKLFRPPYGKITGGQHRQLRKKANPFSIVMWSVLSGDFDVKITPRQCLDNVLKHAGNGSVIVFHDSEKAFERLKYALPQVLKHFSEKGFVFEKISL